MSAEAYRRGEGEPDDGVSAPARATAEPDSLPLDVTFDILRNRRRRLVLEYLRDADDTVTIGELAEHIAAIENDTTVQQLNAQQRKRVYIGLYQCHLPKMDDAGVVDFDQNRGRIALDTSAGPLYDYLDAATGDRTDARPAYYAALALGTGVLFVVARLLDASVLVSGLVLVLLAVGVAITYLGTRSTSD